MTQEMPAHHGYARRLLRVGLETAAFAVAAWLTAESAVIVKQTHLGPPLVALESLASARGQAIATPAPTKADGVVRTIAAAPEQGRGEVEGQLVESLPAPEAPAIDEPRTFTPQEGFPRYFDGRPIRPVKTVWMKVTAYSPDWRSCGGTDDGYTATNHSVWTNAMRMVAADTRLLPFGSIVSVPGYCGGETVPVLDCGSAIKGQRLDVLYPTHEVARKWGVRRVPVTIWEYADGKGSAKGAAAKVPYPRMGR